MTNGGATKKKEDLGGKCLTLKTLTSLELNSTKRFEQNIFSFGIILYTTIKITGKFWSLQVFMAIMLKGWVTLPNQMNFRKSSKGGDRGQFQSKNLCWRFWTFKQGISEKIASWFSGNKREGGQRMHFSKKSSVLVLSPVICQQFAVCSTAREKSNECVKTENIPQCKY